MTTPNPSPDEPATKAETIIIIIGGIIVAMAFSFGAGVFKGATHEMQMMKVLKSELFVAALVCASDPNVADDFACRQLGEFSTRKESRQ